MRLQIIRCVLGLVIAAIIVAVPWAYYVHRTSNIRNFRVVHPGVLYRSGQMSLDGLKSVIHEYGIKTVITFRMARDDVDPHPDVAEEEYCQTHHINYHRIAYRGAWSEPKGENSADARVARFCKVMNNPRNYPVLVHCFAGIHRTGAYCAVFRMEFDGWQNKDAIKEMKDLGYDMIEEHYDLYHYLCDYQPRFAKAKALSAMQ